MKQNKEQKDAPLTKASITQNCLLYGVDEAEYRDIAETIWGGVPFDVAWAIRTGIYQDEKRKRDGINAV